MLVRKQHSLHTRGTRVGTLQLVAECTLQDWNAPLEPGLPPERQVYHSIENRPTANQQRSIFDHRRGIMAEQS